MLCSTNLTMPPPSLLNAHEVQTRILNIRYVLKQLNITQVQRARFLSLLTAAETELLGIYEGNDLCEITSLYSRTDRGTLSLHGHPK